MKNYTIMTLNGYSKNNYFQIIFPFIFVLLITSTFLLHYNYIVCFFTWVFNVNYLFFSTSVIRHRQ